MPGSTSDYPRPNPDALLQKITKADRAKLTVFLGAAAGVGKTFAMLETAHERLRSGSDIVIGWIETHGRCDTEQLVAGLPKIPAKTVEYRGKVLEEMDLDAILARKPQIVLVDELAHTNVPGLRHVRRFQDVEELLKAGIHVYTTLNIQHIESLNDVVAQITSVVVKETVPDHILEQADSVQLIDIPSEDLIKRLQEGKVYIPSQAEKALKSFFRPGNINALRELSLRFTAERVDHDLTRYMQEHQIQGPWPASGRVMVCVSASPFSTQLIRAARRLAAGLHADWLAVHIEAPQRFPVSEGAKDRIARNMRLAEELGGKTLSMASSHLVEGILQTARANNVTAIVVGKPQKSRLWEFFHGSVVDALIRRSGGLNVYVIQTANTEETSAAIATKAVPPDFTPRYYLLSTLLAVATTLCGWLLKDMLGVINIALFYQLPVTISAFLWGRYPAYFTAITSILCFDFFFIPPVFTFTVDDIRYLWSFATFLIVAFLVGKRTETLQFEAQSARQRENSTRALYKFTREIVGVLDMAAIAQELAVQTSSNLLRQVIVLLPNEKNRLEIWGQGIPYQQPLPAADFPKPIEDSMEAAVSAWVYKHHEAAGRSTDTLPSSRYLYFPLAASGNAAGVLGIEITENLITPEQRRLMEVWVSMAAIALERIHLAAKAQQAALVLKSDQLLTALFNSISHELRTPLASVLGSTATLLEAENLYTPQERHELLESIKESGERMDRIIANLLDTARLESGMLELKHDWCDVEDLIKTTLWRLRRQTEKHTVILQLEENLPLLKADFILLEQVLVNLIDNGIKYSTKPAEITISATASNNIVTIQVADRGYGIPPSDLPYIFDKFYRVQHGSVKAIGTGMGLSICKGIIEAHGGQIAAGNNPGGGAVVTFSLPAGQTEQKEELSHEHKLC